MGIRLEDARRVPVSRPASPGRHLWWDRLRGAISMPTLLDGTDRGRRSLDGATAPTSAATRAPEARTARGPGSGTHARLLCRWVREAGDGLVARFVTRRSIDWSPLRAGLHALAHINR